MYMSKTWDLFLLTSDCNDVTVVLVLYETLLSTRKRKDTQNLEADDLYQ